MHITHRTPRRDWLSRVLALGGGIAFAGCIGPGRKSVARREQRFSAARPDAVWRENQRPGTLDWMLTHTAVDPASKYRCPWIEGYASRTSVSAGEEILFHVSTNPPSRFTVDIYRTGYYGGAGARHLRRLGPFAGQAQPEPPVGPNRLRECPWEPCTALRIPPEWLSGVYLGKLTAEDGGWQSYLIFIVRDRRRADFLFQCSDTTWQAYNRWPNQFALYDDGHDQWYWGPGVDVSFDRPYARYCQIFDAPLSTGSGEWFLWEFPLAYWLEARGGDVTYLSNLDTHADPAGLRRAKAFLSVGHDEYYSIEMYDQLRAAIADGLNVAFLSGNVCCGRIDPRPNSRGVPHRIYGRVDFFGPRDEEMIRRFPSMGRLPHTSPNSDQLVGAGNVPPCTGGADWICTRPDHWLYAGTGMRAGDAIPGLIGWEWHGRPPAIPGLEVVATGPTTNGRDTGVYTATIYPGPKGNYVFNASTCWWADGLSAPPGYVRPKVYTEPRGPDPRVQRMTANLLDRARTHTR